MRSGIVKRFASVSICLLGLLAITAVLHGEEVPAERLLLPGQSMTPIGSVIVRAAEYKPAYSLKRNVLFRLNREWEWFECSLATPDNARNGAAMTVMIDGKPGDPINAGKFSDPVLVRVNVADVTQFGIWNRSDYTVLINPRFIRGKGPDVGGGGGGTTPLPAPEGYVIPIDPRSISELVSGLKEQVAGDSKLGGSIPIQLAVGKFKPISDPTKGTMSPTVGDNVLEDLSTELIKSRSFKLVERSQMEQILAELKINETTGLIDSATAKKLGKMTGANAVLIGSISDRGKYAVINCRLINTETGEASIAEQVELRQ